MQCTNVGLQYPESYVWLIPLGMCVLWLAASANAMVVLSFRVGARRRRHPSTSNVNLCVSLAAVDAWSAMLMSGSLFLGRFLPAVCVERTFALRCLSITILALKNAAMVTSVVHLLIISLNQLFGIVYPVKQRVVMTSKRIRWLIALLWIMPTLFFMGWNIGTENDGYRHEQCQLTYIFYRPYRLVVFSMLAGPFLTTVLIYGIMLVMVSRRRQRSKYSARGAESVITSRAVLSATPSRSSTYSFRTRKGSAVTPDAASVHSSRSIRNRLLQANGKSESVDINYLSPPVTNKPRLSIADALLDKTSSPERQSIPVPTPRSSRLRRWLRIERKEVLSKSAFGNAGRAINTTLIIVGSFGISWLPTAFYTIAVCEGGCLHSMTDVSSSNTLYHLYSLLDTLAHVLLLIKWLTNPLIYAARFDDVRNGMRWLCRKVPASRQYPTVNNLIVYLGHLGASTRGFGCDISVGALPKRKSSIGSCAGDAGSNQNPVRNKTTSTVTRTLFPPTSVLRRAKSTETTPAAAPLMELCDFPTVRLNSVPTNNLPITTIEYCV